jgi:hypothetical protein
MANFETDKELQKFGEGVMGQFHEDKCGKATIIFAFRDPAEKAKDRVTLAKVVKVPGMWKALGKVKADFIIIVAKKEWETLNEQKREALIDHQLCHCGVHEHAKKPGKMVFEIIPHDVGEFSSVFGRHGIHCDDMIKMIEASKQLDLFKE